MPKQLYKFIWSGETVLPMLLGGSDLMKEIVYSVHDLESEQVATTLDAELRRAVLHEESGAFADKVTDVQVSWLGERIILNVEEGWDDETRQLFEEIADRECAKVGARLIIPANGDTYVLESDKKIEKAPKKVSFTAAVAASITAVVLAVLVTFSLTTTFMRREAPDAVVPGGAEDKFAALDVIDRLFKSATLFEDDLDDEELVNAVLKAYVSATGDRYARYYTDEEYQQLLTDQRGELCGIGVTVIAGKATIDGLDYETIEIIYVTPESPADKAGLKVGDHIYAIGNEESGVYVDEVGYSEAVDMLLGEEGTNAEFIIYRKGDSGDEFIPISAKREKIETQSVMYSVCTTDKSVGIVRIGEFDDTTPSQLDVAITSLLDSGCKYFVLDLRNNGGGLLTSVEDCMSYFLQKGDTIIRVKDKSGTESASKVLGAGIDGYASSGSGKFDEKNVGKYADLDMVLLVNGYTASAAELFTADFRDYGLAEIVGSTTYGKGSVQSTLPLERYYGIKGALKLTTKFYYPAKGEGFDGKGIAPDHSILLSDEAATYHPNLLPDELDNQLQKAIEVIKK